MQTSQIVDLLDREFCVHDIGDPYLAKHALTDTGRTQATKAFLNEKSGLMFDFTKVVSKAYCVVFTTRQVLDLVLQVAESPCLLFTHHPHDYHEDARGFGPFPENCLPGRWENYLPDYWEITLPKHWEKYLTFTPGTALIFDKCCVVL